VIVLDASVVVELLTNTPIADSIRRELAGSSGPFIAPHLLDIEVTSALRRLAEGGRIDPHHSQQLLRALAALPAERFPHTPLFGRIWQLRHTFTVYDAAYIALAEATNSVLYTCDAKLSSGHRARIWIVTL
jgi:predicted nucleic acid-binding protein